MLNPVFKERATEFLSGQREAFATTILGLLLKVYGQNLMSWDGLTIQMEVRDDFQLEMPRTVYDRLMALLSSMTSNQVFIDVPIFDETVSALVGKGLGQEQDAPPVEDVAWAVTEILLNDPRPKGRNANDPWSRNIKKYVRVVLDDEGMPIAPKALDFAGNDNVNAETSDDEAYYAGVWGVQAERAKEVDTWLDDRVALLLAQLEYVGVQVNHDLETVDGR